MWALCTVLPFLCIPLFIFLLFYSQHFISDFKRYHLRQKWWRPKQRKRRFIIQYIKIVVGVWTVEFLQTVMDKVVNVPPCLTAIKLQSTSNKKNHCYFNILNIKKLWHKRTFHAESYKVNAPLNNPHFWKW